MRIQSTASLALSLLLPLAAASGFDCEHIKADGYKYDLSALGGVHELYHVDRTADTVTNTTYVLNICNILKGAATRGKLKCGTSKNICGFVEQYSEADQSFNPYTFPIVGLDPLGHGSKDPEITRLKKIDPDREGLLVKLTGGEYRGDDNKGKKKNAGAVIEFLCDPDRSGLEGLVDEDDKKKRRAAAVVIADDEDDSSRDQSLSFKSFGKADDDSYVLKLDWRTRYACDEYKGGDGKGDDGGDDDDDDDRKDASGSHWGFFTWMIIILFLGTATYLVFGSWLNYSRYGARGWDLLPHGDTIRDIPYIFQDWLRRVVNTLQGTGSRGGYSAV
ncbi:uncharacterized protein PFLUO_LOCUS1166 [Penicillium psychrofluorescens]|uniref:uncharacterized protein n=1 Tax=Penicillium psychrofluorescens TaxID=3158075 RepID=UPI003CCD24AD